MDTKEIRCPSGLRGRIRKLLGRDFHSLLIDSPEDTTPDQFADLADAIWVETIDPGPYRLQGNKPMFRSDVLLGDRTHALIQSRVLTDGGRRPIRIQCEGCKQWWPDVFDYGTLDTRVWPDADDPEPTEDDPSYNAFIARRRFAAGEPCSTKMPDDITVYWHLLTGSLLAGPIRDYSLQFGDSSYSDMAARICAIDGIDLDQYKEPRERRDVIFDWLTEYPDPDIWDLWGKVQDHECGPETDVAKECPQPGCGHRFGLTVDTMGFIAPAVPKRSMRLRGGARKQRI